MVEKLDRLILKLSKKFEWSELLAAIGRAASTAADEVPEDQPWSNDRFIGLKALASLMEMESGIQYAEESQMTPVDRPDDFVREGHDEDGNYFVDIDTKMISNIL